MEIGLVVTVSCLGLLGALKAHRRQERRMHQYVDRRDWRERAEERARTGDGTVRPLGKLGRQQ